MVFIDISHFPIMIHRKVTLILQILNMVKIAHRVGQTSDERFVPPHHGRFAPGAIHK